MRMKQALAMAAIGAATMGGVSVATEAPAQAYSCSSDKINARTAQGWCSSGTTWRLGIRCSNGQYHWTQWYARSTTVRLSCVGSNLTHHWIDNR